MKITSLYCFAILFFYFFTACKTNKDLTYLSDTVNDELITKFQNYGEEYTIKTRDNLYVDIQAINSDISDYFNPIQVESMNKNSQQQYGQPSTQYLNGFHVDSRGFITLPVIGKVNIEGKTLEQARSEIEQKANEYLKDATVKIRLLNYKITVLGEVKNPGVYYNYNHRMTVLDGISLANGITDYGQIKKVMVLRTTERGAKTIRLDLTKKKFLFSEAFFLEPNDVLYVEPDKYKNFKINSPVYSLLLSTISTLVLVFNVL